MSGPFAIEALVDVVARHAQPEGCKDTHYSKCSRARPRQNINKSVKGAHECQADQWQNWYEKAIHREVVTADPDYISAPGRNYCDNKLRCVGLQISTFAENYCH